MQKTGKIAASAVAMALMISTLQGFEGRRLTAYQDLVGRWTACYGETRGIKKGDVFTPAQCDAMLAKAIVEYEAQVDACLNPPIPVPILTKISFVSFAYNVGTGQRGFCGSTLLKKANAGDLKGACDQLPRWNKAGGRIVQGLTNRRISERELCLAGLGQ